MASEEFITQLLQLGVGGIDLKRSIDLISPLRLAQMDNLTRDEEGRLVSRLGQNRLAWGPGGLVHSLARIQTVLAGGEYIRLAGIDSGLYWGTDGAFSELARDFSGLPLSLVPGHPPLSGDSWMYVGDSAKMVKVRSSDRLTLPVGLPQPEDPCIVEIGSDNRTIIDEFNDDPPTGWTANDGTLVATPPATGVQATFEAGMSGTAINFQVVTTEVPAYGFFGKAYDLDLSKLEGTGGIIDASDDDQFYLRMRFNRLATAVDEVRIYFVISDDFDAAELPGSNLQSVNSNAYVKSFIPAAFTPMLEGLEPADTTVDDAVRRRKAEEEYITNTGRRGAAGRATEQHDETRAGVQRRLATGVRQWTVFGQSGTPLRRGEFLRIGTDSEFSWATVKGIIVYIRVGYLEQEPPVESVVDLQLDSLRLVGGYNPDASEPTSTAYDYRFRHVDPRTGVKGRLSPVMEEEDFVDPLRQVVKLTPQAYGDPAIRQEFFRRGGTIPSNWYFVGTNLSDGGCGKDNVTDTQAVAAGPTIDTDFHEPVTTVDKDGDAIYAQPLPVIFGPAPGAGILFGLGDPYRPGHAYWTLPDQYDHWPLSNNIEVCSPEEELMNGGIFGGQGFAFSRQRLHSLYVNLVDASVKSQPSACAKGLAARWGMVVGIDAIYFVATDGIWKTVGGVPQNLTDDFIEPLFRGQRKNGYAPIDWATPNVVRLGLHLNELWFLYQDIDGDRQVWVYSLIFKFWRHYEFGWPIASLLSEEYDRSQLLLGSASNGRVYTHEGTHDDGLAIAAHLRTGALNQGMPRQNKLFGDLELEADLGGVVATVVTYADLESGLITTKAVAPLIGPHVYLIDAFGATPLLAKDVSLDISWSSMATRPWIGRGGPSFVLQPESSIGRITEWDTLGSPSNKLVKGVLIEANTFGFEKNLQVMVDGSDIASTTFMIQTTGRDIRHVAFASQLEARNIRLVPSDTSPWTPYEIRWVFDTDPLELTLWETQPTDHMMPLEQTLGDSYITLRSTSIVTLTITATRENGTTTVGTVTIPSTAGVKKKIYTKLPTLRGVLFQYSFSSSIAHRLFREESMLYVQPWGAEAPIPVQPFGTDDLDVARVLRDAEGGALRAQRWLDQSVKAGQT